MHRMRTIVASLLVLAAALTPAAVRADDGPATGRVAAPADAGKGTDKGADARPDDAALRTEKAKHLVKDLEDAVARAKVAQPIDQQLLLKLLEALDQARALTHPVKLSELSADEKKALADDLRRESPADPQQPGGGGPGGPGGPGDWMERQITRALDGADLSDGDTAKAKPLVQQWFKDSRDSMGDFKKQEDLRKKLGDDLEKSVGQKKANKILNNLTSWGPRGR